VRNLWRDLPFGLRLVWKNPVFTSVAVLALALGIGANIAIFSVVYATLLAPLPYRQPDRIVMIWSQVGGHRNVTAAGDYLEWKRQSTSFESMAAWTGGQMSLTISGQPEQVRSEPSTPGFLNVLGRPLLREMPERHDHSRNLIGKIRIELCAESLFCGCTTFWRDTPLPRLRLH
jgi:putative ABC transport system permease protein